MHSGNRSVRYRVLERLKQMGDGRRRHLLPNKRCEHCDGTGIDKDVLADTFLNLAYYNCTKCAGTGDRDNVYRYKSK